MYFDKLSENIKRTNEILQLMKVASQAKLSTFTYGGQDWEIDSFISQTLMQGEIDAALYEIHRILYCIDSPEIAYKKEN
jgi:hypothetical protein